MGAQLGFEVGAGDAGLEGRELGQRVQPQQATFLEKLRALFG